MLKRKINRIIVSALVVLMLLSISVFADVYGEQLTSYEAPQGVGMSINKGIYWTGSDYVNENYIEYTPNETVKPMVVYGSKLTNYGSYSAMASLLESKGYHAIAGINGDYYNMSTYEPIGIVIYEGNLISSDSGTNAVGFKDDGTAIIGRPYMNSKIVIGETEFSLPKINKARNTTDFSLMTPDYGSDTKSSDEGYDIICTPSEQYIKLNSSITLTVDEVKETNGKTAIPEGKMILTISAKASEDKIEAVKALQSGDAITVNVAASALWNDVVFAVGSYRKLVTNGQVETSEAKLDETLEPRSAIGVKADGTIVVYTVDGRRSGYSVGATMTKLAQRLIEMGCVEATIMDGGGSTSMNTIYLGDSSISQVNKSSGGTQRSVTNYIVLATKVAATGQATQLTAYPLSNYMLVGNTRSYGVKAADEYGYAASVPGNLTYNVEGDIGTITDKGVFTATKPGIGGIKISSPGLSDAVVTVHVAETPDSITVKNQTTAKAVNSITLKAGASIDLTAVAMINHVTYATDDVCYDWSVEGDVGTITDQGKFTANDVTGEGKILVSAGDKTVSVAVSIYQNGAFDDVKSTDWYYDCTEYVNSNNLITGTANRTFSPNVKINRAMMATVLWRLAGKPVADNKSDFTDVEDGTWYSDAVAWAQSTGIVNGYEDNTFHPKDDISREQMAAMLYRYESVMKEAPETGSSLSGYPDADSVSSWATEALAWCVSKGIINGMDGKLAPADNATRAQCAAIIQRYCTM